MSDGRGFAQVYRHLMAEVRMRGLHIGPRGEGTMELLGHQFSCSPDWPLALRPGWSEQFALTETAQVIAGRADIRQLRALAPQFEAMAPTYVTYGPRIAWQLRHVVEMLRADPGSRQAVVQVHEPGDTGKGYPEDPCTLSLQFLIRGGRLHLVVTMRSNDLWLGTPTDVYMFTLLQREMASVLGLHQGHYFHQAGSLHLYDRHRDREVPHLTDGTVIPERTSLGCETWEGVVAQAKSFLDGEEVLPWSGWLASC